MERWLYNKILEKIYDSKLQFLVCLLDDVLIFTPIESSMLIPLSDKIYIESTIVDGIYIKNKKVQKLLPNTMYTIDDIHDLILINFNSCSIISSCSIFQDKNLLKIKNKFTFIIDDDYVCLDEFVDNVVLCYGAMRNETYSLRNTLYYIIKSCMKNLSDDWKQWFVENF